MPLSDTSANDRDFIAVMFCGGVRHAVEKQHGVFPPASVGFQNFAVAIEMIVLPA